MAFEQRVYIDFETRSMAELKKTGGYKYSLHPTTSATCLAWKVRNDLKTWLFDFKVVNTPWRNVNKGLRYEWELATKYYTFHAHNAFFDRCIYENVMVAGLGWPAIPVDRWRCTAAKAAACALPRSLENVAAALGLSEQKDKAGYIAMMKTCKPTREYKKRVEDGGRGKAPDMFLHPWKDRNVFETLYHYCKQDVITTEAVDEALPDLSPFEQEIWHLNQRLNMRGIRVDRPTIEKITRMMAIESKSKLKELDTLTMGLVTKPGARASILAFLALEGIELPDIRAQTVEDVLKEGKLSPDMKRLLEIRKALSKTSTRKYQAFLDRVCPDGRVRDILMYHGAHTGRDTGTGVQFQNLAKRLISQGEVEEVLKVLE